MINFFRNKRKKLAEENKAVKYTRYAIGEIVLVVIGILIALSINNWNQNRINKQKEAHYLFSFKNDLEAQIVKFKGNIQFYGIVINSAESILSDYSIQGNLSGIDSINTKLSKMMYSIGYPEIKTTFNEVSTTGHIDLIQSKPLRTSIINYYQMSEANKLRVNGNEINVFYGQIFPTIKHSTILLAENFSFKTNKINKDLLKEQLTPVLKTRLNDPSTEFDLVNAVSTRLIVAKTNLGVIQKSKNNAEVLLMAIKIELNNK